LTGNQTASDPLGAGYMMEYINIFFLLEIRAFYAAVDEIAKHTQDLRDLYQTIGEIDALQSAASYRASLPGYAEPEFVREGIHLEVSEARQPLLEKAVPASVGFQKNVVLITGSNMGGKSTFLRNIGTNALLAQTIATTLTSHYKGNFFQIITSISRTDDLLTGKSFYYVEAERILRTMQSFRTNMPTLCIIDELLSGTNSTERLQASEAIIRYLARQNSLAIIATHDLELAERLDGTCDIYHFTDNVDDTGLKFDYLLKPGVATTRNAIALLKYLGYPKEITDEAG
jgi:DNA mismatch repair ATPase MutS